MKLKTRLTTFCRGFTRVELLAVLSVLGLLAALALPGLANQRTRFDRIACVNNLRMIGQALQAWGNGHGGNTPWRTPVAQGGTSGHPIGGQAWFQFSWISNQLASPRLLVCPTDWNKRMATNWSSASEGGFLHPSYRGNALSYFVGLEAQASRPTAILSGDRNLRFDTFGACSAGVNNAPQFRLGSTISGWTNFLHDLSGNLLLNDGRVLQTTVGGFRSAISNSVDNGSSHVLLP